MVTNMTENLMIVITHLHGKKSGIFPPYWLICGYKLHD